MKLCTKTDLPTICSSCRQPPVAYPVDRRPAYVNFDAAYDGPVVGHNEAEGAQVYVENIVICENCLKEAGRLVGLTDDKQLQERITSLEAWAEQLEAGNREKDKAISNLNHTVSTVIDYPIKRSAGRPKITGPSDKKTELAEVSKRAAKRAKAS